MIKIEPLYVTDSTQIRALLRHQDEPMPYESFCAEDSMLLTGFSFWQHWLPCQWHIAPSVYVAKEDGIVLGLISLHPIAKSRSCWKVDHLVVHPHHRGRGIAQELLRFALALFGSQGISHFIAEVSDQNSAALSLLGSVGFRRCARIIHYQLPTSTASAPAVDIELTNFRLALPEDQPSLCQLHQDALPADIRLMFNYSLSDFSILELKVESFEKLSRRLLRRKTWFWVACDSERKVITSAAKVTAHHEGDYHLEFAVHPGWQHTAGDLVSFVLNIMRRAGMKGVVIAKAYDFQTSVIEAVEEAGMERVGEFTLMAREHWLRAKQQKKLRLDQAVGLPSIKPAINLPRAASAGACDGIASLSLEYKFLEGFDNDQD